MRFISQSKIWLLLATGLSFILFLFLVPPLQTPDEPAHLRYVIYVAENWRQPSPTEISRAEQLDNHPQILKLANEIEANYIARNPNFHRSFDGDKMPESEMITLHYVFNHPPLYYIWGALIYTLAGSATLLTKLYLIRLSGLVFLLISAYYVYRLLVRVDISRWLKLAIYCSTLLWPMYLFISAGINSDILVFTASIAMFTLMFEQYRKDRSEVNRKDLLHIGFWMNVGLLTKAQFLPIAAASVLLLILIIWRRPKLLALLGISLLPSAIYFVGNILFYSAPYLSPQLSPMGGGTVVGTTYDLEQWCYDQSILHYIKVLITPRMQLVLQSFVGHFGWLDTKMPVWHLFSFVGIIVLGAFGWFLYLLRRKGKASKRALSILIPSVLFIGVTEIFYIVLYLRTYLYNCYPYFPTQGRYYFIVLFPLMTLVLLGISKLAPRKDQRIIGIALLGLLLTYLGYSITQIVIRYYL